MGPASPRSRRRGDAQPAAEPRGPSPPFPAPQPILLASPSPFPPADPPFPPFQTAGANLGLCASLQMCSMPLPDVDIPCLHPADSWTFLLTVQAEVWGGLGSAPPARDNPGIATVGLRPVSHPGVAGPGEVRPPLPTGDQTLGGGTRSFLLPCSAPGRSLSSSRPQGCPRLRRGLELGRDQDEEVIF